MTRLSNMYNISTFHKCHYIIIVRFKAMERREREKDIKNERNQLLQGAIILKKANNTVCLKGTNSRSYLSMCEALSL